MSLEESIQNSLRAFMREIIQELFQDERLPKASRGVARNRANRAVVEGELTPRPICIVDCSSTDDNKKHLTAPRQRLDSTVRIFATDIPNLISRKWRSQKCVYRPYALFDEFEDNFSLSTIILNVLIII